MAERWMQKAVRHPGAFRKKAEAAGMSTGEYARKVKSTPRASTKTKRQAALAQTFSKYRGKRKSTRSKGRRSR
jgi:hypothetical protein